MSREVVYYFKVDASGAIVGAGEAEKGFKRLDAQTDKTSHSLMSLNKVATLVAAAGLGRVFQQTIRRSIERGREFETQLASLEAITGITGTQLEQLGANSLELSKKYGTSASNIIEANKLVASQLAEKIDFGTQEGFEALQKVSEQAIVLSRAAGIQLSDAVATTTSIINQFNLSAAESERVINTLAAGSKFGAAEIPAIGAALVNAGSAAAGANVSIEETNALIQVLAANGQVGERAGTALRAIFLRLQTSGEQLAKYGLNEVNLQANGMAETLRQLAPIVNDATAMQQIFGQEAFNAASILIRSADSVESMTEKVTGTNTAYEQAAVQMDTFDGATQRLQATIDSKLIPAFMESNGVLVKLINIVSWVIEEFAGGITIINAWLDTHSRLKKEIGMADAATENHIQTMARLREELAQAASEGSLTAEQYRELAFAYDLATENLRQHASGLADETDSLRQNQTEIEAQIERYKTLSTAGFANAGAQAHFARTIGSLNKELESLSIEIEANEARLQTYMEAIDAGTLSFDEFIQRMKEANSTETGGTDDTAEVIQSLLSIAQLKKAMHDEQQAFTAAESHEQRLVHHQRLQELQEQLDAIEAMYATEEVSIGSISGLKKALSDAQKDFNNAETQQERERHFERMEHLQAELDFIQQSFVDQTNNLASVSDYQRAIAEERKAYNEATNATDREMHMQRILQLEYELESIVTGIEVEELIRLDAHEEEIERHRQRMSMLDQYYSVASQMASSFASISASMHQREMQREEEKKKASQSRYDALLANEKLTEAERQRLINQRTASEEAHDRKIAEIKRKAANAEKAWNSVQVVMSTAVAVMKAAPNVPLMITTGIAGAVQLAAVLAQPIPQFEKGGKVGGKLHSDGGQLIEAERGEFVINRQSAAAAPDIIEILNADPVRARRINRHLTHPLLHYAHPFSMHAPVALQLQRLISNAGSPETVHDDQINGQFARMAIGGPVKQFGQSQRISGPGTGKSDSIKALLPEGSFILNAASTQAAGNLIPAMVSTGETYFTPADVKRYGHMLEALNANPGMASLIADHIKSGTETNAPRAFADGGMVSRQPVQPMRIITSTGSTDDNRQFMEAIMERLEGLDIPIHGQIEDIGIGLSNDRYRSKINKAALTF